MTLSTASFLLDFFHEGDQIIISVHVMFFDREEGLTLTFIIFPGNVWECQLEGD